MSVLIQLCSRYLARIIFIPCILLGMVVITNGVVATRDMGESVQDQHNVELASVLFDVVHELQKERGRTAGFIGSKGQQQ